MIEVIGYLGVPNDTVRDRVAHADLVVGGERQLTALDVPAARRITLGSIEPAIVALCEADDDTQIVVLASGDPTFYGIVRRLRLAGLHPRVTPAPSAVAMAFAAIGVPRDEAITVSAHGRNIRPALSLIRTHPKVAVMTSPSTGIRQLAAALPDRDRWFVLAERLGETDEQIRVLTRQQALQLSDVRDPNVVLVLSEHPDEMASAGISLPVAGQFTDARNLELVDPTAALAFAALLPRQAEICWVAGEFAQQVGTLAQANFACVLDAADPTNLVNLGLSADVLAADSATEQLLSVVAAYPPRRIAAFGEASEIFQPAFPKWDWSAIATPAHSPKLVIGDRP